MALINGKSIRETMELRVAAELSRRLPYFKSGSVLPYNGELTASEDGIDLMRRALNGRTPGVMIATADSVFNPEDTRGQRYTDRITLHLFLMATNYRSRIAQVHGDRTLSPNDDPGLYKVAEDVTRWLSGFDLDIDNLSVLRPSKLEVLHHSPAFCLWLMSMTTSADRNFERRDQQGGPLTEVSGWFDLVDGDETLFTGGGVAPTRSISAAAGVATLVDPAAAFIAGFVGCQIEITGANAFHNNGVYDIASVPTATSLTFAAPRGASENPYVGTYKIRAPKAARVATETEE